MMFGSRLFAADSSLVWTVAQALADANGSPVGIWCRDGWLTICENAPDDIEPNPELSGWRFDAIVEPSCPSSWSFA